jgi:DNA-binding NtrC family response regulator
MPDPKSTILIIDDDKDFCLLLSSVFDEKRFEVISVYTLEEATRALSTVIPGIVILDNRLPDGKGIDFIDKILETDPRISILMISGERTPELNIRALQRGVTQFIAKPCSFRLILDAVEAVV